MSFSSLVFTVVIPLYNKELSITRSIDSVLRQRFENFDLIVIDDGSSDNSRAKVLDFNDKRIRLLSQSNKGVSATRNRGVREAKTPYITFLDADDEWDELFLSEMQLLINRFPNAGAYASGYFIQEPEGRISEAKFKYIPQSMNGGLIDCYFKCIAYGNNPVWSSAVCVPVATFNVVGGFPEGVRLYEDLDTWSRIAVRFPIAYINKSLSTYHKEAENRAFSDITPKVEDLYFIKFLLDATKRGDIEGTHQVYVKKFINRYVMISAFKAVLAGEELEARSILRCCKSSGVKDYSRRLLIYLLSFLPLSFIQGWRYLKRRDNRKF